MKNKNKVIEFKPIINERVTTSNGDRNAEEIPIRKHDNATITIDCQVSGWAFDSDEAISLLRQSMHEKLDRQFDRFVYKD